MPALIMFIAMASAAACEYIGFAQYIGQLIFFLIIVLHCHYWQNDTLALAFIGAFLAWFSPAWYATPLVWLVACSLNRFLKGR